MNSTLIFFEAVLDTLYKNKDKTLYNNELIKIKSQGYRVYRNAEGQHKIVEKRGDV